MHVSHTFLCLTLTTCWALTGCTGDDSETTQAASSEASSTSESSPTAGSSESSTEPGTTDPGTGSDSEAGTDTQGTTAGMDSETAGTDTGSDNAECVVDSDCQKIDNCCECSSIPADETPEDCVEDCLVGQCTAVGLDLLKPACRSGVCAFDSPINCSGPVVCNALPPECESGFVPSVVDGCWGACVPYRYCADTSNCDETCGPEWTCITSQSGGYDGCVPLPSACAGEVSCACFAPYWNEVCPGSCGDGTELLCEDGG